jgi:iron complex outermembrane receptor protein
LFLFALSIPALLGAANRHEDLTELSLESLMDIEVTSVSKKPEKRVTTAEAVYVLTGEDIYRSGVTTIPDALRLVPGVQVARINSHSWAVGIRGFATSLARSVLVLIDGRTVYNPLFAGTYWELQDLVLADIDRIEVIRGPGGALWGANAFNGVINIITKTSTATQGGLVSVGGGTEEHGFAGVRYGGGIGDNLHYRLYGKYFNRDAGENNGQPNYDDWEMGRGGFRVDWQPGTRDELTLQGDLYTGDLGNRVEITRFEPPFQELVLDDTDTSGGNVLGRWTRTLSATSSVSTQLYYDHTFRRDPNFREERDTFDVDAQHRFGLPWNNDVVWGLGYRLTSDDTGGVPGTELVPSARTDNLFTGFVQNETALFSDRVRVTVGTKLGHNDYTGFEVQPNGRLSWLVHRAHTLWGSIGRAVRIPSRVEYDADITVGPANIDPTDPDRCLDGLPCQYPRVLGNRDFGSEELIAYQLGWRALLFARVMVDTVVFYHDYHQLLSLEPGVPFLETSPMPEHIVIPLMIENNLHGKSYGVTLFAEASVTPWWRLQASYGFLEIDLRPDAGSNDTSQVAIEDSSPRHQAFLVSHLDLPGRVEIDADIRYVDDLPAFDIREYITFDVRLAYHVHPQVELSLVGQNLWDTDHREFPGGSEVERGGYAQVRYRW